jgi:hypothetical protein
MTPTGVPISLLAARLHRTAICLGLLLAVASRVTAQNDHLADFNSLRTPSSPAFVLLGVEPSSVERPNTPADFAASVLSSSSNLTSLPRDFALETSPYWLFSHRKRTWRDDIRRNISGSIERTFTLSVATAELGTSDQPVRGLAVAGRMALFSGRLPDSSVRQIEALETSLAASAARDVERLGPLLDALQNQILGQAHTQAESLAALPRVDSAKADLIAKLTESGEVSGDTEILRRDAGKLATAREGFLMDLAGGVTWRSRSAALDSTDFDRWGLWLTATYTMPQVSFVGTARYLDQKGSVSDAIDIGVRFIYTRDRYAVSAEYVGRHPTHEGVGDEWRLAALIDYRLSSTLWISGTFGRSYDDAAPGSLLAQLGLTVNLSKERYQFAGTGGP